MVIVYCMVVNCLGFFNFYVLMNDKSFFFVDCFVDGIVWFLKLFFLFVLLIVENICFGNNFVILSLLREYSL